MSDSFAHGCQVHGANVQKQRSFCTKERNEEEIIHISEACACEGTKVIMGNYGKHP